MAEPRPKLEVVGGATREPEPGRRQGSPRGPWIWLLAAALALALVGLVVESRRAAQLADQAARLGGELAAAEAALEAHRGHLEAVRGAVAELGTLVGQDPEAAPPAPAGEPSGP